MRVFDLATWVLGRALRLVAKEVFPADSQSTHSTLKTSLWAAFRKMQKTPLDYIEQHREIKIMAGGGMSLFLLPLPITLDKAVIQNYLSAYSHLK